MPLKLLNLLSRYFSHRIQGSLFSLIAPIGPLVKQLSLGIGSMILGVVCFLLTIFFLAVSFFFFLIDHADWSISGLWTCFVLALIGLLFTLVGRSILTNTRQITR